MDEKKFMKLVKEIKVSLLIPQYPQYRTSDNSDSD